MSATVMNCFFLGKSIIYFGRSAFVIFQGSEGWKNKQRSNSRFVDKRRFRFLWSGTSSGCSCLRCHGTPCKMIRVIFYWTFGQ